MVKLIAALMKKGRRDLAHRIKIAVFDTNSIMALPDSPEKIALLKRYLVELRARRLVDEPIRFLTDNKIIITDALFEDIFEENLRYKEHLISTEDYALNLFWIIKNFVETIIARYTTSKGKFPTELDVVGLRTMLESL